MKSFPIRGLPREEGVAIKGGEKEREEGETLRKERKQSDKVKEEEYPRQTV